MTNITGRYESTWGCSEGLRNLDFCTPEVMLKYTFFFIFFYVLSILSFLLITRLVIFYIFSLGLMYLTFSLSPCPFGYGLFNKSSFSYIKNSPFRLCCEVVEIIINTCFSSLLMIAKIQRSLNLPAFKPSSESQVLLEGNIQLISKVFPMN